MTELKNRTERTLEALGIAELLYVEDLPVISASVGYTRRSFEPTYEELGAKRAPTQIRAFPSLQREATQALGKPELLGTIPVLAREGEHEGIFVSLQPDRVLAWLEDNGIQLADHSLPPIPRILNGLEPVDK